MSYEIFYEITFRNMRDISYEKHKYHIEIEIFFSL